MYDRYLCRAKRTDNGEWVEGGHFLEPYTDKVFIIQWNSTGLGYNEFMEVIPETLCQCTGLRELYGKLIFEKDIVREKNYGCIGIVAFGEHEKGYGWHIKWVSEKAVFYREDLLYWQKNTCIEVIGNAIDNPELLEVGE